MALPKKQGFDTKRQIRYKLVRGIALKMREGFHTKDVENGQETGYFFDREFTRMRIGKMIYRTVEEADGNHGFETREVRKPEEEVYQRLFRIEGTGMVRDIAMTEYPFDHGQTVKMWLKYHSEEVVEINIVSVD